MIDKLIERNEYLKRGDFWLLGDYVNMNTKILCEDRYGLLLMRPYSISKGSRNGIESASNKNEYFANRAKEIHGDKYDYSLVEYKNTKQKVKIICDVHGEFEQHASCHLDGKGCNKCAILKRAELCKSSTEEFINKAVKVHGDKYDYDKVDYTIGKNKVIITCPIHGDFEQIPNGHLYGFGCEKCGKEKVANSLSIGIESFMQKAKEIHGDLYEYIDVPKNVSYKSRIKLLCKEHGEFTQRVGDHLRGNGCNKCGNLKIKNSRMGQPNTWTLSGWYNKAVGSPNFDSYKFYLLRFFNDEEEFIKSGVTFVKLDSRYSSRFTKGNYEYEILRVVERHNKDSFEDCEYIFRLERRYQNIWKKYKYQPLSSFHGENECFIYNGSVSDSIAIT